MGRTRAEAIVFEQRQLMGKDRQEGGSQRHRESEYRDPNPMVRSTFSSATLVPRASRYFTRT
jgi:hypothetical protein